MFLSLLAAPPHAGFVSANNASSKQKPRNPVASEKALKAPVRSGLLADRFSTVRGTTTKALPQPEKEPAESDNSFLAFAEAFRPSEFERKQYEPAVLKKYPVIGAVQKNLKQNSAMMREILTQWLNDERVDQKLLARLEKRLSVVPAPKGWEKLSNQIELLRPVKGWEDVLHNSRTLIGVPGAMAWTGAKTVEFLTTPLEVWMANPKNSFKAQVLEHNRYLLSPDTHQATLAYYDLNEWRSDLQQRLQLLKTLVRSQSENGKISSSN